MLRHLVRGGWARRSTPEGTEEEEFSLKYRNEDILSIIKSKQLNVVRRQLLEVYWTCMPQLQHYVDKESVVYQIQETLPSRSLD